MKKCKECIYESLITFRLSSLQNTSTQVEKYDQVPAGKHRNSLEQGGSIPAGKFSDFFLWLPVNFQQETGGKRSKVTGKNVASFRAEYRHPVSPTSGAFLQDMVDYPAFSCWFPQDPFSGSIDLGSGIVADNLTYKCKRFIFIFAANNNHQFS